MKLYFFKKQKKKVAGWTDLEIMYFNKSILLIISSFSFFKAVPRLVKRKLFHTSAQMTWDSDF